MVKIHILKQLKKVTFTAPGPGSGKLATCLNQLYHENKSKINVGYSKFETFQYGIYH